MAHLIPSVINSLLNNHATNTITPVVDKGGAATSKIVRKQYYDHYDGYGHHDYPYYSSGGGKKSKSVALSALTLLSFLFFLHILQQCLQEQMDNTNPQVLVMQAQVQAAREAEAKIQQQKQAQKRVGQEPASEDEETLSVQDIRTTQKPATSSVNFLTQKPFNIQKVVEDLYQYQSKIPIKLKYSGTNGE